jgi:hypothetical protein
VSPLKKEINPNQTNSIIMNGSEIHHEKVIKDKLKEIKEGKLFSYKAFMTISSFLLIGLSYITILLYYLIQKDTDKLFNKILPSSKHLYVDRTIMLIIWSITSSKLNFNKFFI